MIQLHGLGPTAVLPTRFQANVCEALYQVGNGFSLTGSTRRTALEFIRGEHFNGFRETGCLNLRASVFGSQPIACPGHSDQDQCAYCG